MRMEYSFLLCDVSMATVVILSERLEINRNK